MLDLRPLALSSLLLAGVAVPALPPTLEAGELRGPYLGQPAPGLEPVVFAPGAVSSADSVELNAVFSPDGREFLFARRIGEALKIFSSRQGAGGLWSPPEMVDFSRRNQRWDEVDMWFTADGRHLYYISNAPVAGFAEGSVNIWRVERRADGWDEPEVLPPPVNSDGNEIYPMLVASGDLYFSSTREGGFGGRDLYRARAEGDGFTDVENLGPVLNTEGTEGDLYVAPDESYLIVTADRPGGLGRVDLYISFRRADGAWGEPKNLGAPINSAGDDFCPVVSPDGRYFFFTRKSSRDASDLYWMSAEALERFRPAPAAGHP